MALSKNPFRELELAFGCGPFVLFGDALDAIARIIGISVRSGFQFGPHGRREEMANRSRETKR
jgi:hypothetical protein